MARSPEAIAAAAVARIQQEAFQAGLKEGRAQGYRLGWEACTEKVTTVMQVMPSMPRALASAKFQSTSDNPKLEPASSTNELEIQQWIQLSTSTAPEASRSFWQLLPDYIDKDTLPVDDLELNVMTYNALKREGMHTVGDVTRKSLSDFFDIRHFGKQSFRDLYIAMARNGYDIVTRTE